MENNKNEQIEWLKHLMALVGLAALMCVYFLVKKQGWDNDSITWELVVQITIELISALIVVVVLYYAFIKKGIDSESRLINDIATKVKDEFNESGFMLQEKSLKIFDLNSKLKNSKEILISGYSCRYLIAGHRSEFKKAVLNKTDFKILIIEPNSLGSKLLMENQTFKEIDNDLRDVQERLQALIKEVDTEKGTKKVGKIEIRVLSWLPSCAMIVANPINGKFATLKLKIYAPSGNVPLTKIMTHMVIEEAKETELFNYFKDDFYRMWEKAKPI
jgi:hypothetical protein